MIEEIPLASCVGAGTHLTRRRADGACYFCGRRPPDDDDFDAL